MNPQTFVRRTLLAMLVAVFAASGVALGEHLKRDYVDYGSPHGPLEFYMGTGDPDNDSHIHSFTEVDWQPGPGCKDQCEDDLAVEIRRADKRYPHSYEEGPYNDCLCHHVHVGLNTKYNECHYYTKHWYTNEPVTFHHDWCGAIRG